MPRAGEIASRYRVALYDCPYIALAERDSCEVNTADRGITNLQPQFSFILNEGHRLIIGPPGI
jgi:predicted nucleic acid-binding protein